MALPHVQPGEVFNIRPLGKHFDESKTHTLVKTAELELLRLVLPAGKSIPEHRAPSEITVQCIEGRVTFTAMGKELILNVGEMLFLPARVPHALRAEEPSSLLVTILLKKRHQRVEP